ncbi:MAG TPA: M13 family metallopeptidase [Aliidongia sp.]|nr:M13 family metallopeptidase [Aliidongia sp.]
MRFSPAFLGSLTVALFVALHPAPARAGFDALSMDPSVSPCEDFYRFACGGWLKANPSPPDQPRYGRFNELALHNRDALRQLLEAAVASPTGETRKVADFYGACIDEAGIERKGLTPLQPLLDRIAALSDKKDLAALIAQLQESGIDALFDFGVRPDFKDTTHNLALLSQGGLGLPDRDYYFKTDEKSVSQRAAYQAHVAKMLSLLGDSSERSEAGAKTVMTLETALAQSSLNRVARRDPSAVYHKMAVSAVDTLAPDFGWAGFFRANDAPAFTEINVAEPDFFKSLDTIVKDTPLDDLKIYLRWQLVHTAAPMLPKAFVDESFAFYGKNLTGAAELEPRWRRCVIQTDRSLGEALGKLYVEKHFPPAAKARMQQMVADLRAAYAEDLKTVPWMGAETRERALGKLDAMIDKIGYPEKWRDYSKLAVTPDDALGNFLRANAFETHRELDKIGQPVDRKEWGMTPPTVNAYYSQVENDINFPAGILQLPFFDPGLDDAANYGAIGSVIGHEMTHGFDDQGRKFDKDGNLGDWWTKSDAEKFETRASCLADEASGFTAVDDVHLNGKLTLGENTADNGGLHIAFAALKRRLADKPQGEIDGFTADQRFFIAYAQDWCSNQTPEISRFLALNDPHPAAEFRANGVLANMGEFAKAFKCPVGSPMVHKDACRVW